MCLNEKSAAGAALGWCVETLFVHFTRLEFVALLALLAFVVRCARSSLAEGDGLGHLFTLMSPDSGYA